MMPPAQKNAMAEAGGRGVADALFGEQVGVAVGVQLARAEHEEGDYHPYPHLARQLALFSRGGIRSLGRSGGLNVGQTHKGDDEGDGADDVHIEHGVPAHGGEPAADKDHDGAAEHLEGLQVALDPVALRTLEVLSHQRGADDLQDADADAEHAAQDLQRQEGGHERGDQAADEEQDYTYYRKQLFAHDLHELADDKRDRVMIMHGMEERLYVRLTEFREVGCR